jgi:DNA-binding transcriptional MerR regulator
MTWDHTVPGHFVFSGRVSMLITRGDGLVTTGQAAQIARRKPSTIRSWVSRGHLAARGLSEQGHPLYHPDDVARAEKRVRENGLRASGIDPRAAARTAA